MKQYYLVTTEHLENRLWFRDEDDFAVGMNHIAVQVSKSKVNVLAFILMSNHVHFIIYGEHEDVLFFINGFKARYSQYVFHKYGVKELLRRNSPELGIIRLEEDEAMERAIAYVQMNCVAARICAHPSQYPWGTGNSFFNAGKIEGKRVGKLSGRAAMRLFHCGKTSLPGNWVLSDLGFVRPESYVNIKMVENIFRRPERMNYFLNTSSKARKRMEAAQEQIPAFRDQSILNTLPDLCQSLFKKNSFKELSLNEKTEMLRQIRFRFSSDVSQIARVCGLTYAEAARMLDTY